MPQVCRLKTGLIVEIRHTLIIHIFIYIYIKHIYITYVYIYTYTNNIYMYIYIYNLFTLFSFGFYISLQKIVLQSTLHQKMQG